jgi:hypothetical protein
MKITRTKPKKMSIDRKSPRIGKTSQACGYLLSIGAQPGASCAT